MDLTDFKTLKNLLKKYRVWAKKKLGQNFLIDKSVLETIIDSAEISQGEKIVEVGPGSGVLTQALLESRAKVEAVEIDKTIIPALKEATRKYKNHINIHIEHVLGYNPPEEKYKLISNIPYYLTSPILRKFLSDTTNRPTRIVLLVQKEVAQKICEKEGRDSLLSIMVKTYGKPELVQIVSSTSFYPEPKVDSAILKIEVYKNPLISIPSRIFEQMLFDGFSEPRKKIRNILTKRFLKTSKEIEEIFQKVGISGDLRPQNLTIENWEELAKIFFEGHIEDF